eukprot:CAMPEP_0118852796 /NCGR_PEP_ID=MMETSP1163-20130328/1644_1 /TAXON_ID=124430 /ORGANISM="Phaeomonas parva, Strain CCMP2877" /LENGTH=150 /DNA_ID=CAMNT_0006785261 /DNA_START=708 /DNA_END=1161 /DNA_ORIENTATION=-
MGYNCNATLPSPRRRLARARLPRQREARRERNAAPAVLCERADVAVVPALGALHLAPYLAPELQRRLLVQVQQPPEAKDPCRRLALPFRVHNLATGERSRLVVKVIVDDREVVCERGRPDDATSLLMAGDALSSGAGADAADGVGASSSR